MNRLWMAWIKRVVAEMRLGSSAVVLWKSVLKYEASLPCWITALTMTTQMCILHTNASAACVSQVRQAAVRQVRQAECGNLFSYTCCLGRFLGQNELKVRITCVDCSWRKWFSQKLYKHHYAAYVTEQKQTPETKGDPWNKRWSLLTCVCFFAVGL